MKDLIYQNVDICPICAGVNIKFFSFGSSNPDLHQLLGNEIAHSSWWHCSDCNHVFLNPRFSDSIEARLYGPESLYRIYSIGERTVEEYLETIDNTIGNQLVHLGHLRTLEKILSRIGSNIGVNALDFGAGFGAASSAFKKIGMNYMGYEFDEFCLAIAKRYSRNVVKKINSDYKFDFAYSAQVFEHISSPTKAILDMAELVKIGGYAFINVPTHQYKIFPPANIGMGGIRCLNWGHVQSYSKESIESLVCSTQKFKLVDVWFDGFDVNCLAQRVDINLNNSISTKINYNKEIFRFNIARFLFAPMHKLLSKFRQFLRNIVKA